MPRKKKGRQEFARELTDLGRAGMLAATRACYPAVLDAPATPHIPSSSSARQMAGAGNLKTVSAAIHRNSVWNRRSMCAMTHPTRATPLSTPS